MYLITKNANYQEMTNGYVLTPISTINEAVLKIGYPNRLVAGNTYGISYLYEGNIGGLKLYTTIKGLSQITGEIEINKGKFVAPEGVYDLQLEFSVDNSSLNNSVEVYNIQIENNEVSEYETHEENKNMLYIPEGFAHGFVVLSSEAELLYKTSGEYNKEADCGIFWADEDINVDWGVDFEPILSEKDKAQPRFRQIDKKELE